MDVCLLNMPYAGLERPSIALGILEGCLKKDGRTYASIYANLLFAEEIGIDSYYFIELTSNEDLLGEWTFSPAAFPDFAPDPDAFFALFRDMSPNFRATLTAVRARSRAFIDRLADRVLALDPRIVGCTSTFQQNCASLALLRQVKERDPSVVTMMGGANCETQMGLALLKTAPWLDYVVSGEAEALFPELVGGLLANGADRDARSLPEGVLCGAQARQPAASPAPVPRAVIGDMDSVPVPEYGSYFEALRASSLRQVIRPGLLMETSRGCWWGAKHHCTFCGLNGEGMAFRSKSPTRVLEEFDALADRHRSRDFEIVDNILDMRYLDTVLPRLSQSPRPYRIFYETKSNLKRHQVERLASAGVRWIQPGIESLHDEFLKLIDKGVDAIQNIQLLKWCREQGIRVSWNVLFGAPGERDDWYAEMAGFFPLLYHLQPPQAITKIRYDRFSPYFNRAALFGLQLVPSPCYAHVYPVDEARLREIAYFFEDESTRQLKKPIGRDPLQTSTGQRAVERCIHDWAAGFWGMRGRPLLCTVERQDGLGIVDTRPVAAKRSHRLDGLAATVYRACGEAVSRKTLLTRVRTESNDERIAWDDLEGHVGRFLDDKLMLFLSGKYLALALDGDIPRIPGIDAFPGGYLDVAGFSSEHRPDVAFPSDLV